MSVTGRRRGQSCLSTSRVRSLRIHPSNDHEFSDSSSVASLFHPLALPLEETEESVFWNVRVQLFDFQDSVHLYFDDRPTVQDALILLWNTLRPKKEYSDEWYLTRDESLEPLQLYFQLSHYLSEENTDILYLKEYGNDEKESIPSCEILSSSPDVPILRIKDSKPLPASPMRYIDKLSPREPKNFLEKSPRKVKKDITKPNHILRQFFVILSTMNGKESHLSVRLDISKSVFLIIQDILNCTFPNLHNSSNSNYIEYGLFVPKFQDDNHVTEEDAKNTLICIETQLDGYWMNNDLTLENALSLMEIQSSILFIKPRTTPREILLHLSPSTNPSCCEHKMAIINIDDIGVVMTVFSNTSIVEDALDSVKETIRMYLPSSIDDNTELYFYLEEKKLFLDNDSLLSSYYKGTDQEIKLKFLFDKSEILNLSTPLDDTRLDNRLDNIINDDTSKSIDNNSISNSFSMTEEQERELQEQIQRIASQSFEPILINGEKILATYNQVVFSSPPQQKSRGMLFLTNFQLIFYSGERSTYLHGKNYDIYIPITTIMLAVEFGKDSNSYTGYQLYCKNFRNIVCSIEGVTKERLKLIDRALHGFKSPNQFFSFSNVEDEYLSLSSSTGTRIAAKRLLNGWDIYNAEKEYQRIGLTQENGWRITKLNNNYKLCNTYPSDIIVPKKCSDELITKIASFRSKERVPATVWRHPHNGASLTRCAQPRIGIRILSGTRSSADESLFQSILQSTPSKQLCVVDCRPIANAKANHLRKGGYEDISNYTGCSMKFLDIGNIHVVRESFMKLHNLCQYENSHRNKQWLSRLENTHWLQMVSSVLKGSLVVTKLIDKASHVVVHCSDGWDRTSQISALSQFLLDPYYRTLTGFQVLIEKEWLSFGHMFSTRIGHIRTKQEQQSPIFLIFIDCIYQIMQQYPCSVEFNEQFLIFILDNIYSCRFGTFLRDCEYERKRDNIQERTISLWTLVNAEKSKYLNVYYRSNFNVLYPSASLKSLQLWPSYYLRYSSPNFIKEIPERIFIRVLKENQELKKKLEQNE